MWVQLKLKEQEALVCGGCGGLSVWGDVVWLNLGGQDEILNVKCSPCMGDYIKLLEHE